MVDNPRVDISSDYFEQVPPYIEIYRFGETRLDTSYPLDEDSRRSSLIGTFEMVFNDDSSPYDENWDYETLNEFIDWTLQKDYEGYLAVREGRVVGFTWGYRVDPENIEVRDKFPDELRGVDEDIYDGETLMLDELGVLEDEKEKGIGRLLEDLMVQTAEYRKDISRAMQRTQWSSENTAKLRLDGSLGFKAFLQGEKNDPVTEEVPLVGKEGSDERIYLFMSTEGDLY